MPSFVIFLSCYLQFFLNIIVIELSLIEKPETNYLKHGPAHWALSKHVGVVQWEANLGASLILL